MPISSTRQLLINCDDLGMHPSVNRAIGELLDQGIIQSVSLMPTSRFFDDAVSMLREKGHTHVGVHLALSSEYPRLPLQPVSETRRIRTLTTSDGLFPHDFRLVAASADIIEVKRELTAQIDRVRAAGLQLTHIDGHMFFYLPGEGTLEVFQQVCALGFELGVPVRGACSHLGISDTALMIWDGFNSCEQRFAAYDELLNDSSGSVAELIIHPADNVLELAAFTAVGERRLADYRYFSSPKFRSQVGDGKLRILSWREIQERMPKPIADQYATTLPSLLGKDLRY